MKNRKLLAVLLVLAMAVMLIPAAALAASSYTHFGVVISSDDVDVANGAGNVIYSETDYQDYYFVDKKIPTIEFNAAGTYEISMENPGSTPALLRVSAKNVKLILNNVNIDAADTYFPALSSEESVELELKGDNTLKSDVTYPLNANENGSIVTISGDGVLNTETDGSGCIYVANLVIESGAAVSTDGGKIGIAAENITLKGEAKLSVSNAEEVGLDVAGDVTRDPESVIEYSGNGKDSDVVGSNKVNYTIDDLFSFIELFLKKIMVLKNYVFFRKVITF